MRMPPTMPSRLAIPQEGDYPVFQAPWQAQAFGLVLSLYDNGCFTWPEWVDCLSAEIRGAQARGDADLGDTYYHHWLAALETLVSKKGLASAAELATRRAEWEQADRDRAFGEAPVLPSRSSTPAGDTGG